jgi:hypothetical protein
MRTRPKPRMPMNVRRHAGMAGVALIGGATVLLMLTLVVMGVTQPEVETYEPTPPAVRPAHGRLVGPIRITVDARDPDRWRFFSFEQGSVVEAPGPLDWDVAFRRFQVIANGGPGFAGAAGFIDLGEADFDAIDFAPGEGYQPNAVRGDTVNAAVKGWYSYSFLSHVLSPRDRVYGVRTASGRHAILQFLGYYCPGAVAGCVTFRYVYQGGGGFELTSAPEVENGS